VVWALDLICLIPMMHMEKSESVHSGSSGFTQQAGSGDKTEEGTLPRARKTVTELRGELLQKRRTTHIEELALNAMDKIGGDKEAFTAEDVMAAIHVFDGMKKDVKQVKQIFVIMVICFIVFSATMFGLMWATIELAKDFRPTSEGMLKTPDGQLVGTSSVVHNMPLNRIHTLSNEDLEALSTVSFSDGVEWSSYQIAGVTRDSNGTVIVNTRMGESIHIRQNGDAHFDGSGSPEGRRLISNYDVNFNLLKTSIDLQPSVNAGGVAFEDTHDAVEGTVTITRAADEADISRTDR